MKQKRKIVFSLLLLCVFSAACTQPPAVDTPSPTPRPTESAPELPRESTPLPLAGKELTSAAMLDFTSGKEGYPFWSDHRMDQEAGLEEAFREWEFSVEAPFYQYNGGEKGAALTFYYDAERDCGLGIFCRGEGQLYGFGPNRAFPVYGDYGEDLDSWLDGPGSGWGEIYSDSMEEWPDAPFAETKRYDGQGRLSYAEGYITHGRLHYYYIYQDDGPIPAYLLRIDDNLGYADPLLLRYPENLVPEPLPEGSPLTLAGEELESAIMMDIPGGGYGFSKDAAANLEGWFQLLGFQEEEPFYEDHDRDGALRLRLWYDEESGVGLGIRYRDCGDPWGICLRGFGFTTTSWAERDPEAEKSGFGWYRWEDPYTLPEDAEEITGYEERRKYDQAGHLTSLASYGVLEGWPDTVEQPMEIYFMKYEYDEAGVLFHRQFGHSIQWGATTNPGRDGYYDDQGRLVYEYGYITHGSTHTYYIYEGEEEKPSYALYLDDNLGADFPEFVRYR